MSISIPGIGIGPLGLPEPSHERRTGPAADVEGRTRAPHEAPVPSPAESAEELASPPTSDVDPRLWEMLSAEERSFYVRNALSGPLTYGPSEASQSPPSPGSRLGGRIDLRA